MRWTLSNNAKKPSPFDVKTVESLIALMSANDMSEIYLRDGTQHMRLRRGMPTGPVAAAPMPFASAPVAVPAHAAASPPAAPVAAPTRNHLLEVKSETVGTFYAQPKPGDPPYVKVGDRVTPNTPVGIIVVMKTNNEVLANCTGVVAEVLVKNDQFVDFGQVLFRVEPS